MKLFKYIALSSVLALSLTSCEDWLDVNTNPDQPSAETIMVQHRLPWLQRQYLYSAGCANTRTFASCGGFYSNNASMNTVNVTWNCAAGLTTTPYQMWFVSGSSNYVDLYKKAEAEGAYHYMAAAEVIHAMGFMEMADLYGEIPYTEALGESCAPEYSDGKTIWEGCLKRIDHAIELFNMTQPADAAPLSSGDIWNGGDVNKWIKLCYGLKARWLLRVTKNPDYYKPDEILAALEKAPKSNADNTYQACFNSKSDKTGYVDGDPVMTNGNWDTAAYGKNQWASKYYIDLLTNMRGAGVEDPRVDKLVPSSMTNIKVNEAGNVTSYEWRRAVGVDIYGDAKRLVAGGPASIQVQKFAQKATAIEYTFDSNTASDMPAFIDGFKAMSYTETTAAKDDMKGLEYKVDKTDKGTDRVTVKYPAGAWYIADGNYSHAGDTVYVNLCSGAQKTNNGTWGMPVLDVYYHGNDQYGATAGAVSGTGAFQTYCVSDYPVITYSEMCFIKAEVLMRKGDKSGAQIAYKAGIQANIDAMQDKLNQWKGEGYDNPSMQPMDQAAINTYMSSNAIANSSNITMSDIMLQKYIAMSFSMENWVDMRRFNFSAGNIGNFGVVYPGYGRTKLYTGAIALRGTNPDDVEYWIRRWRLPSSLELNYNGVNALKMNANAMETYIWGIPVWWDCTSDAEYAKFLQK